MLTLSLIFLVGSFCGLCNGKQVEPPPQIIGGNDAKPHEFPWQAIVIRKGPASISNCGGSLLNKQWILTAAHCIVHDNKEYAKPHEVTVKLGAHRTDKKDNEERTFNVLKVFPHERYVDLDHATPHDIALLKLTKPVTITDAIMPIDLAAANAYPPTGTAIITGWGIVKQFLFDEPFEYCDEWYDSIPKPPKPISYNVTTACGDIIASWNAVTINVFRNTLQKIAVQVTPNSKCSSNSKGYTVWCLGGVNRGSCNGDSGGPMVQKVNGKWRLFGVTSFGSTLCTYRGAPSVYTRVNDATYLQWINNKISKN